MTGISTEMSTLNSKQVTAVETPFGTIKTKNVVNCTGVWSNYIADMVSSPQPLFLCLTHSVKEMILPLSSALMTFYGHLSAPFR